MDWKQNLLFFLNQLGLSDLEIYAWTNISTSVLSNMRNNKHDKLLAQQFGLLRLLSKKTHPEFLDQIFGEDYFKSSANVISKQDLTELGLILRDDYDFEKITRNDIIDSVNIKPPRLKYILFSEDQSISIEEISLLETFLNIEKGILFNKRFKNLHLNDEETYELLLRQKREENAKSNERRKSEEK